jgi:TolB-like protein/Flp pilus assembly protein TadD
MAETSSGLSEQLRAFRFGPFELDLRARELRKRGIRLRLPEKPFQILELLLEKPGVVVTRREIRDRLWPGIVAGFDRSLNTAVNTLRQTLGDSAGSPRFVETRSRRGYRFIAPVETLGAAMDTAMQPPAPAVAIAESFSSIAVLPFENAGGDPESDYLSDGITESILQSLSQLPTVRVMARSSVFRYKGRKADPRIAGREMNVHAVLTGIVEQNGAGSESLVVSAELVEVANGWRLWGERFERKFSDILKVEQEMARDISENLRLHLTGEDCKRLARHTTEKLEAYQDYLKGRYHWNKLTEDGLRKGIAYFEQAILKDPGYALAYSGLADAYGLCGFFGLVPPQQVFPRAKEAALKAVEADPNLGEAHASLASVLKLYDWDWAGAEREYQLAIALNPNYVNGRRWHSSHLLSQGRREEARREILIARELDPLNLITNMEVAWNCFMARDYQLSLKESMETLELEPDFPAARYSLGLAHEQLGNYQEAVAALERARDGSRANAATLVALGHAYARSGRKAEAERVLEDLRQWRARAYVSSYLVALVHAGLGDAPQALACLESAFAERDSWLVWLKTEPRFDSLRGEPRFQELIRRVGFPA